MQQFHPSTIVGDLFRDWRRRQLSVLQPRFGRHLFLCQFTSFGGGDGVVHVAAVGQLGRRYVGQVVGGEHLQRGVVVVFTTSPHHEVKTKTSQQQYQSRQSANDNSDVRIGHVAMVMRLVTDAERGGADRWWRCTKTAKQINTIHPACLYLNIYAFLN